MDILKIFTEALKGIDNVLQKMLSELGEVTEAKAPTPIKTTPPVSKIPAKDKDTIKIMIKAIAKKYGVDPDLAIRVAQCESGLNPDAKRVNVGGSVDRGLYQWNNRYHPDITDEMAYDPKIATELFCQAVSKGHLSWWNASRHCWER